ncbi:hypothetical protein B296_00017920 [Ensete ventricosum]|uniref:Uncharacterized protein n=1 Tax=Ensete ventricosum TaxID=4639 RepID=A0A427A7S2_ENSVE|nr:hypothetical protein B296_00017920 [Ensete ventricosum]
MLSCDSERREGVCHEPKPLMVLMGWAVAATGKGAVQQGSAGVVEEEDGDGSDSDVSKAFTMTGDPSQVNVQIITVCASTDEGEMVEEGAQSTKLGNWKQQRWWRKGSSREWCELRCWQRSFAVMHIAAGDEEKGSGYLC